jgi:hypothetical protein
MIRFFIMKKNIHLFNITTLIILCFSILWSSAHTGKAQSDTDWSTPVNVSASGIATNPISVVDFKGIIHVIWVDKIDGYRYSKTNDSKEWTTPTAVKFPFTPKDLPPVLMADPTGFVHIFWISEKGEFYYAQSLSENFGNPSLWVFAKLSSSAVNFDVVVDSNGMIHLAYIENITDKFSTAGVYYRQSLAGSGSWTSPIVLYKSEYFRGSLPTGTSIRIAASNQIVGQTLYITWDNRPQKRIYISASVDAGKTWVDAQQFKGPEDTDVYGLPFNFSVWAKDDDILLMWQTGEPGASKCSIHSQWSNDAGKSFGNVFQLFGGPTVCPTSIKFIKSQDEQVAVLLSAVPSISLLLAWNGAEWSNPLPLAELPVLSNPDTDDTILLGCRHDLFFNDTLYVIGCDQAGGSGDIWFLSRELVPLSDWFTPISIWSQPTSLEVENHTILSITSAVDGDGGMHVAWVQNPASPDGTKPAIYYSRWNGNEWSVPEPIVRNQDGMPLQLTIYIDSFKRLMLAWVDGSSGDIKYTWANLDQASQFSEWEEIVVLPSPSISNSAPDIVVDSSGRIVVAYAVSINENRGIYITQSIDNGASWLPFNQAFDAVAAKWESVDSPKITLDGDGVLHLIYTRQSRWDDQAAGLYYSQSRDGGETWSAPKSVTIGKILWSDLILFGKNTLHRLWQEDNGLVVANLSQVSLDGGVTWGNLLDITGVNEQPSLMTLATNGVNLLHVIQITKEKSTRLAGQESLFLYDSKWDGARWDPIIPHEFIRSENGAQYAVTAGVTAQNYLGVFLAANSNDINGISRNKVVSLSRFLELVTDQNSPVSSILPTPLPAKTRQSFASEITPTPVTDLSALYQSNDPSEGVIKNLAGLVLIGIVFIILILLFARRKPHNIN